MTTSTVDRLVTDYLARLEAASAALPPERRDELLEEISSHITTARAAGAAADEAADEAAVRTLLERLGQPEVIAAAALDDSPSTDVRPGGVSTRPPSTSLELAAVLMLTVGSFLPVVGWLVGLVLLWVSSRWTAAEKLLGTLVVPLGPGGVIVLGGLLSSTQTCSSGGTVTQGSGSDAINTVAANEVCTGFALPVWLGVPLFVVALVAPIVIAVVLYRRARARATVDPTREVRRT